MKKNIKLTYLFLFLIGCNSLENDSKNKIKRNEKVNKENKDKIILFEKVSLATLKPKLLSDILCANQYYIQIKDSVYNQKNKVLYCYDVNKEIIKLEIHGYNKEFVLNLIYVGIDFNIYRGKNNSNGFFLFNKISNKWYFLGNSRKFSNKKVEIKDFCEILTIHELNDKMYPSKMLFCSVSYDGIVYENRRYFLLSCIYKNDSLELDHLYGGRINDKLIHCNDSFLDYLNILDQKSNMNTNVYLLINKEYYKLPIWKLSTSTSAADSIFWENSNFPKVIGKKLF